MMRPFTPGIDSEIDRIAAVWLGSLADWRLDPGDGGQGVCRPCLVYSLELQLDEVPHAVLHELTAAVEDVIALHADPDSGAPLGDLAVADVLRRRAAARLLALHPVITAALDASIEPQIRRLADLLLEETCGR